MLELNAFQNRLEAKTEEPTAEAADSTEEKTAE